MFRLVKENFADRPGPLSVLDVGSLDINGSYKSIFPKDRWTYTGVDVAAGKNVDIVMKSPYTLPFLDNQFDLVISGQAFEHIEFFWLTWLEMVRVTRKGGNLILIVPSKGEVHRYPVDCWRFYSDGLRALAKYGKVEVIQADTLAFHPDRLSNSYLDSFGLFRKTQEE